MENYSCNISDLHNMGSVLDLSVLSYGASNKVWFNSHDNLEGLRDVGFRRT